MEIDDTDYALLAAIADAEGPLWKKRIHRRLQHRDLPLPGNTGLSLQSVGRRVNALHEDGLLDTEIVHPPDSSQNLIIGYTLSVQGQRVLDEKREHLISAYVGRTDYENMDRETLLKILDDELVLSEEEYDVLQEQKMEELHVFTVMYHALQLTHDRIDQQTGKVFSDIIGRRLEKYNDTGSEVMFYG